MKLWKPWIEETKKTINQYAKWVFATLVLSFLLLANIGVLVFIINQINILTNELRS